MQFTSSSEAKIYTSLEADPQMKHTFFLLYGIFMTKIDLFSIIYNFKSEKIVHCMAIYMIAHYVISILTKHFALRYNKKINTNPLCFPPLGV